MTEVEVTETTIRVGARGDLIIFFRDENGIPCQDAVPFTVQSNMTSVATVPRGTVRSATVTGVAPGRAVITVRTTGRRPVSGLGIVTVTSAAQPPVVLNGDTGDSRVPEPARIVTGCTGPGSASCAFQPEGSGTVAGLLAEPNELVLLPGEAQRAPVFAATSTGAPATRAPMAFNVLTGDEAVSVDSTGLVTSLGPEGDARVRVSLVGLALPAFDLAVRVESDSVSFGRPVVALAPSEVDTVLLRVPAQDRNLPFGLYRYRSSATGVATVNPFAPIVTGVAVGTATITATSSFLPDVSMTVHVHPPVARLEFSDSNVTLAIGGSRTVTLRPVAADGTPVPEAPADFTGLDSSRVSFAYDTAAGVATLRGVATGVTSVTMTVRGGRDTSSVHRRTLRIRVVAGALRASVERIGIGMNDRARVTLTVLDENGQPIAGFTPPVTWTSSDSSVARMEEGQVVPRGLGHARLTARAPSGWDSTVVVDAYVVGDLIIAKAREGQLDLWMRSIAGQWSRITSDSLAETYPTWGPTLSRIAFVTQRAGTRATALVVSDADGANRRTVFSRDSGTVRTPSFIRDGQSLVFDVLTSDGRTQIWTVNADGSDARQVPLGEAAVGSPAVSPDGRLIAFSSLRGESRNRNVDIYVAGLDGTNEVRLTQLPEREDGPRWAPDGRSIYYLRRVGQSQRVYRQGLSAGDTAVAVTPETMYVNAYSISGDGTQLALTVIDPQTQAARLVLLNPGTGAQTVVPLDAGEVLGIQVAALRPRVTSASSSQ